MEEVTDNVDGFLDYQGNAEIQSTEKDKITEHTAGNASKVSMSKGYTPFHYAASGGNVQILQALFEKAPREILRCCQPVHPIHLAIIGGHMECVKLIIEQARKGLINSSSSRVYSLKSAKLNEKYSPVMFAQEATISNTY